MKHNYTKFIALFCILLFSKSYAQAQAFAWVKQNSGISIFEEGKGIGTDAMGNVYTAGIFSDSADFDPGANEYKLYTAGSEDIYVQKLDASGNFVWAFSIGGVNVDRVHDLYADQNGNVFITGQFAGTVDFDPGAGTSNLIATGSDDIYFAKYTSAGVLAFAKNMGGTAGDAGRSITCDISGNIYVTGYFRGLADFDPSSNVNSIISISGSADYFIAKYDSSGGYIWANSAGGSNGDIGQCVTIDASGNVIVTGDFYGTNIDFDPGSGTTALSTNGFSDIFIAKYSSGGALSWAHSIGGIVNDQGLSVVTDNSGNIYTTGYFQNSADFDPGTSVFPLTATAEDIFILKLDGSGTFGGVRQIGGVNPDVANDINIDNSGNLYLTGYFTSVVDFDPGAGTTNLIGLGGQDIFIAKYDASMNLVWARSAGANLFDQGNAIDIDGMGNVYSTGYFNGTVDFNTDSAITQNLISLGGKDAYVHKIGVPSGHVGNIITTVLANVYPNPVSDIVYIRLDKSYNQLNISVTDVTGKKVKDIQATHTMLLPVNLNDLSRGTYLLNIETEAGITTKLLLKE